MIANHNKIKAWRSLQAIHTRDYEKTCKLVNVERETLKRIKRRLKLINKNIDQIEINNETANESAKNFENELTKIVENYNRDLTTSIKSKNSYALKSKNSIQISKKIKKDTRNQSKF